MDFFFLSFSFFLLVSALSFRELFGGWVGAVVVVTCVWWSGFGVRGGLTVDR